MHNNYVIYDQIFSKKEVDVILSVEKPGDGDAVYLRRRKTGGFRKTRGRRCGSLDLRIIEEFL